MFCGCSLFSSYCLELLHFIVIKRLKFYTNMFRYGLLFFLGTLSYFNFWFHIWLLWNFIIYIYIYTFLVLLHNPSLSLWNCWAGICIYSFLHINLFSFSSSLSLFVLWVHLCMHECLPPVHWHMWRTEYQDRFLNCFSTLFFKTGPLAESGFARESLGLDQDHPISTLNRRGGGEDGRGADKDI